MKIKNIIIFLVVVLALFSRSINFNIENKIKLNQKIRQQNTKLLINISDKDKEILNKVYRLMDEENLDKVASFIIDHQTDLELLYSKGLFEKNNYFDGENLYQGVRIDNEKYLIIIDANSFYLGYISNGKENGFGIKLTAYQAVADRYSYARGIFKDGKLSENAETGSVVLDILSEKRLSSLILEGNFIEDAIFGDFKLLIEDTEGKYSYKLKAKDGVLDYENMHKDEKENVYLVESLEDKNKKFSIAEKDIKDRRWINKVEF